MSFSRLPKPAFYLKRKKDKKNSRFLQYFICIYSRRLAFLKNSCFVLFFKCLEGTQDCKTRHNSLWKTRKALLFRRLDYVAGLKNKTKHHFFDLLKMKIPPEDRWSWTSVENYKNEACRQEDMRGNS